MKVGNEVLAVLSAASVSANEVRLSGQLDRDLYMRTDKVLQAAGGVWNRRAKAHVFDGDAETRIEQIILTGDVVVPKDEYNFFPTPPKVVGDLRYYAAIEPGHVCLEPSAGHGAIAKAMRAAGGIVDCVELNPDCAAVLIAAGFPTLGRDFLQTSFAPVFDRIVMNPPFMKQADIRHVNHALNFLKPGGLLVSVLSAGVMFRDNKLTDDFRELVESRGGDLMPLPEGSFKASGTMVSTAVVVIPG